MLGPHKVILPVWHGVTAGDIARYSPTLSNYFAIGTDRGIDAIAGAVQRAAQTAGLVVGETTADPTTDSEAYWEYSLFAHELEVGLDELRNRVTANELGVVRPTGPAVTIDDLADIISAEMNTVTRSAENVGRIFAPPSIERAFGADGQPGDARRISFLAEQILAILDDLLASAERLLALTVPPEAERLRSLIVQLSRPSITAIVDYVALWRTQVDRMPQLINEHIDGDPPVAIEMALVLTADEAAGAAIREETTRLRKRRGR
jgi:hypothetical protein